MKEITLGKLHSDKRQSMKIPLLDFASQGNAILGIRDSGKSYTATYLAEQLLEAGIPFVAFDPIGVWKYLRVAGKEKGYPVVVAGGTHGDLPLTPQSAPEIVRAAMKDNIPLVIDLYDINLSKADWKRIVEASVRLLLYENGEHGLRHIFIEEAAEFVPQRVNSGQGKVYAEIEKLARMGGNAKLGYTLINQRAEEVNKAVLELCDCLFLHRQKGRNSLTALNKWLDIGSVGDMKPIMTSMPLLKQGDCWVWTAGSNKPTRIQVPEKNTFHPDRRAQLTESGQGNFDALDVSGFVEQLSGSLEEHLEQEKENDPKRLRAEIAKLQRQIAKKETEVVTDTVVERVPYLPDLTTLKAAVKALSGKLDALQGEPERILAAIEALEGKAEEQKPQKRIERPAAVSKPKIKNAPAGDFADLAPGEQKILTVCGQYPDGVERTQISAMVDYKRSSRDTYIQRLQSKGAIEVGADRKIYITEVGWDILGHNFEPLPTGVELQQYWLNNLPAGERAMLEILLDSYPREIERDLLTELTDYKRSSRDTYLQRLSAKELIDTTGAGLVRASDNLFEVA